jgi:hypothetical protein
MSRAAAFFTFDDTGLAAVATFGSLLASNVSVSTCSLVTEDSSSMTTTTTVPVGREEEVKTDESDPMRFHQANCTVRIDEIPPADCRTVGRARDIGRPMSTRRSDHAGQQDLSTLPASHLRAPAQRVAAAG